MRILVALDGSELGEEAAVAAAVWARAANASVVLLTVRHPDDIHETYFPTGHAQVVTPRGALGGQLLPQVDEPQPHVAEDRTQALERAREDTQEYLRGVAGRLVKDLVCEYEVEIGDDTPEAIARVAERTRADLIAVSTHGRSGLSHALMGSVAEALVRRSPVPVLVVRHGMRAQWGGR